MQVRGASDRPLPRQGGREVVMIMGTDKFVGGRIEVAPQSPCRRLPLMVERVYDSFM